MSGASVAVVGTVRVAARITTVSAAVICFFMLVILSSFRFQYFVEFLLNNTILKHGSQVEHYSGIKRRKTGVKSR